MKRLMEARGFPLCGAAAVITPTSLPRPWGWAARTGRDLEVLARFAQGVKDKLASRCGGQRGRCQGSGAPAHPRSR